MEKTFTALLLGTLLGGGGTYAYQHGVSTTPTALTAPKAISTAERDGLLFMREEEKLAHDVYVTLSAAWGQQIFANISQSEAKHMESVGTLLVTYDIPDPAAPTVGVFWNPELQALYTSLVAQGSQSPTAALRVGAEIEELDIADLEERLAQTNAPDIVRVYENLLSASKNHLRAFARQLAATGATYEPTHLSQERYDTIVAAEGNGRHRGRQ